MTALALVACSGSAPERAASPPTTQPSPEGVALLLAMAQFVERPDDAGKPMVVPGPAKLLALERRGAAWIDHTLEDPDSTVFHKAFCLPAAGRGGVLTIGASDALLRWWHRDGGSWRPETWWRPRFGGKWDRLRDAELGDVDGDGQTELVIVTHDQGVVAVAKPDGAGRYRPAEIHRAPDTFVHEVELGDLDRDGRLEIYTTPSRPNKVGTSQGGAVMAFVWDAAGGRFQPRRVAEYRERHAKEILVADLDGQPGAELYVSLEAELSGAAPPRVVAPLEIRQYRLAPGQRLVDGADRPAWLERTIATLDGVQARVLLAADLDGDRRPELIVTTMKAGIVRLLPPAGPGESAWRQQLIDPTSTGFEHAAGAADLDGDGRDELYVSSDDRDTLSEYRLDGQGFTQRVLLRLGKRDLVWNVSVCRGLSWR